MITLCFGILFFGLIDGTLVLSDARQNFRTLNYTFKPDMFFSRISLVPCPVQ